MHILNILIGIAGGMCLAVQSGINSQLRALWAQNAILAATVNFTVGTLVLLVCVAALRIPISRQGLGNTQWWHWTGGLLGGYLVFAGAYLAPLLGAGVLVGLILTGQLCAAIVLDHFGLIGFARKPVNARRLTGLGLLAFGVVLIRFF